MSGRFPEAPRKVSSGLGSNQELLVKTCQSIGTIETAIGPRTLTRAGAVFEPNAGDGVFPGDTIETGPNGTVDLRFVDGTRFVLSSSSHVVLEDFVHGSGGSLHSALLNLAHGAFAFIVGRIARSDGLTINTPLASIRSRSSGSGVGILSLAALTFAAIEDSQAGPSGVTFFDEGEIRPQDSAHGVFELRTKGPNPTTIWVDDPGETVVLDKSGSSTSVTNSATEMNRLQLAQQNALANYVLGLSGPTQSTTGGSSTPPTDISNPLLQPINFIPLINTGPTQGTPLAPLTIPSTDPAITPPTPPTLSTFPTLTVAAASGHENSAIALAIDAHPAPADSASATLTITVSDLQGGSLNHGTPNPNGSYTLTVAQLIGLTYTPASEFTGTVTLTVTVTDTDPSSHTSATSTTQTLAVTVNPVAATPSLAVTAASGNEGSAIALSINASQVESDLATANLTITVSGLQGGSLNHGHLNNDGSYTLTVADLTGLTYTPASELTGTVNLSVTATDTEPSSGTSASTALQTLAVMVGPTADAPNLAAPPTLSVNEGASVALGITASAVESDQQAPTIKITGVPSDATLSAGTLNPDGSWSLAAAQLTGLTLTTGESTHSITLTVTATDTEAGSPQTTQSSQTTINVTVNETADAPNLTAPPMLTGTINSPILLNISSSAAETDQQTPTITISGIPAGASLTDANHDTFTISNGAVTLTSLSELNGLALVASSSATATLQVTATDHESNSSASSSATISVTVISEDSVTVTGAPAVGQTVIATFNDTDNDGIAIKYQWYRDGVAISNATQQTYTVQQVDAGHAISVAYSDSDGPIEATSTPVPVENPLIVASSQLSWKNTGTGDWSTQGRWGNQTSNNQTLPTSSNDCIISPGTATVTSPDVAHSLTMSAGAIVEDIVNKGVTGNLTLNGGTGGLTIFGGANFELWGGTLNAGTIYLYNNGILSTQGNYTQAGALGETIWNAGTVEVMSGALQITGIVGGPGTWQIDSGTSLTFSGPGTNAPNVTFANNNLDTGALVIASGTLFTLPVSVSGFTAAGGNSDSIDLQGVNFNSGRFSEHYDSTTGMLTVSDGSNGQTLQLMGFTGTLHFSSDGANGTLITDPPAASSTPIADASSSEGSHINEAVSGNGTGAAAALHGSIHDGSTTPITGVSTAVGAGAIDSTAMSDPGAPVFAGAAGTEATIFNHSGALSGSDRVHPTDINSAANGIAGVDDSNSGIDPAAHALHNDFLKLAGDNTNATWSLSGEGSASNSTGQPPSDGVTGAFDRSIHVGLSPSTAIGQHPDLGSAAQQDVFTFAATFGQAGNGHFGSVLDQSHSQQLFDGHFNNSAAHTITEILAQAAQVAPATIMHGPELGTGISDVHKENPLTHYFHV